MPPPYDPNQVFTTIAANVRDNTTEQITPAAMRLVLGDVVNDARQQLAASRAGQGPNESFSGVKFVRFISRTHPLADPFSDHFRDELDLSLTCMGALCRVDFGVAGTGPEWYELVYDDQVRTPAQSGPHTWRDGYTRYPTPLVPVKWVLHNSAEAVSANVPAYSPGFNAAGTPAGYPLDYTVTYTLSGEEGFYQSRVAGRLPAPSWLLGDANWRRVAPPVPATVLFQRLSQALAVAMDDDRAVTSGRRYAVELGQGRYVEVVGTEDGRFPALGVLNGEEVRVNVRQGYVEPTGPETVSRVDLLARFADTPPLPDKLYRVQGVTGTATALCYFNNLAGWAAGGVGPGMLVAHNVTMATGTGGYTYDLGADALTNPTGDLSQLVDALSEQVEDLAQQGGSQLVERTGRVLQFDVDDEHKALSNGTCTFDTSTAVVGVTVRVRLGPNCTEPVIPAGFQLLGGSFTAGQTNLYWFYVGSGLLIDYLIKTLP